MRARLIVHPLDPPPAPPLHFPRPNPQGRDAAREGAASMSEPTAEANPLREALPRTRAPEPCAVVLFGATGDLTHRKLMPALYHLARAGHLPGEFAIVGFARRDWDDATFREEIERPWRRPSAPTSPTSGPSSPRHIVFVPGTFDDPAGYARLKQQLDELDRTHGTARQPALLPGRRPRVSSRRSSSSSARRA